MGEHYSDCATNNEPAYKNGDCDCTAILDDESLIKRLSGNTGLTFKIDDDTGGPAASGAALNYWVTVYNDHLELEANSIYDYVFSERIETENQLIDKINELENDFWNV